MLMPVHIVVALILAATAHTSQIYAAESTKVLPRGVRNFNFKLVNVTIGEKTDSEGQRQPLAQPLERSITFANVLAGRSGVPATQAEAFIRANGYELDDVIGSYTADLKGQVQVTAQVLAWGITDQWTMALAVPYYKAQTRVSLGFAPHPNGQRFINLLADPLNNNTAEAREAGMQLANAVGIFNSKLEAAGYAPLEDWSESGLGDLQVVSKLRLHQGSIVSWGLMNGVIAPTGRTDDPAVLNDIAFGNGVWGTYTQFAVDQQVSPTLVFNQFAKYTWQVKGEKRVRLVTETEPLTDRESVVGYRMGDTIEGGASVGFEARWGMTAGAGYEYARKFADSYDAGSSSQLLADETNQDVQTREFSVGYTTVALYKARRFVLPVDAKTTWRQQAVSRNAPVRDLIQFDLNLYF